MAGRMKQTRPADKVERRAVADLIPYARKMGATNSALAATLSVTLV